MDRNFRSSLARVFVLLFIGAAGAALAQGVTGSAMTGSVADEGGKPVEGAALQLRNIATGATFTAVSGAAGDYFFDNIPPGGPYNLTAVAAGYQKTAESDIQLTLGERLKRDVVMHPFVEEIVVTAPQRSVLNDRSRTGSSTTVKETQIKELPLQGRYFTDLVEASPLASRQESGAAIAGQNNRFNNIQIDGAANNDLFGLSSSGTPGGTAGAKPLSLEAVQEFVIQIAPFDVRQGNFAGGLVNAITKSGTNEFSGSAFTYFQSKGLANTNYYNPAGNYVRDPNFNSYTTWQFGGTVSGPIVPDKVHFFVSADLQERGRSFGSTFNLTGDSATDIQRTGFDAATVQRFINDLNTYGITNSGDASAPTLHDPDRNVFVKVSTSLIENSILELSYNFVNATSDVLSRLPTNPSISASGAGLRDGWQLSNSGYKITNSTNSGRMKLTTNWGDGKFSNEFLGGFSIVRDNRQLATTAPLILVRVGTIGSAPSWLAAGGERFSQGNSLDQNVFQLQDNLTFNPVEKHRVTLGTSNEFFEFRNLFLQAATGAWAFNSLDRFEAGTADAFLRRVTPSGLQEAGTARFSVAQLGFYAQDEWSILKNLSVTPGLRIDVPFLSKAHQNPDLVNYGVFPIDTAKVPTGNILWSPRVGANWDVEGNAETIVRGGTGIFSGRPPYVWVSNAYSINGLSQVQHTCTTAGNVPAFTPTASTQPTDCVTATPPTGFGEIDYFDPNTKYPQNLRVAMGVDKRLPWGLIGTIDLLYTQDVNGWYTTDANLQYQGVNGEGRAMYGVPNGTGTGYNPVRTASGPNARVTQAVIVYNKNGGRVYNAAVGLTKTFGRRYSVGVGYTYTNSQDRISFTSSQALSNLQFSPLDGSLENRNVRPSAFDRPHKITVTGTMGLPYGFILGLIYIGQSGTPYTWTVSGDANGDGMFGNDTAYIPASANDITLRDPSQYNALSSFIDSQDCLRNARGRLLKRGECRNPWQNFLDLRVSWLSPYVLSQRIEVQLDIFDVLNLLNGKWGLYEQVSGFESPQGTFLSVAGHDAVHNRPIYTFAQPPVIKQTLYSPTQSRWRIQLGAKYSF